jgi:hypothetical protein
MIVPPLSQRFETQGLARNFSIEVWIYLSFQKANIYFINFLATASSKYKLKSLYSTTTSIQQRIMNLFLNRQQTFVSYPTY